MADGGLGNFFASNVDILTNIANTLPPVYRLITGAAYLIGVSFAFKSIYTLKVYGEARTMMSNNASIKEPVIYMVVAMMFIYLPTGFAVLMNSTFGYENVLAYQPINSQSTTLTAMFGDSAVGRPLTMIIQTIGVVAFVRGWVLVARSAGQGAQPGGTGKGLTHVLGGILAMNIVGTVSVINRTLYG